MARKRRGVGGPHNHKRGAETFAPGGRPRHDVTSKPPQASGDIYAVRAVALVLAMAVLAGLFFRGPPDGSHGSADDAVAAAAAEQDRLWDEVATATHAVLVLPWAADGSSRRRALAAGRPVVFAGAGVPLRQWPILERLRSVEDLAAVLGARVKVLEASTPDVLYYTHPVPLDQQAGPATWRPPNPKRIVPAADLVASLRRGAHRGTYLYHSEPVTAPATRAVTGDPAPFVVTEEAAAAAGGAAGAFRPAVTMNVWAGAAGLAARVHYDTYHNFYLQVLGRKRFRLLPPDAWRDLRLFPAVHPSVRQSQLAWDDLPAAVRERALNVVLAPGEVLYLPSHWFHQVTAVTASVSVNVWTDALSQWREAEIAKTVVPPFGLGRPEMFKKWLVHRMMGRVARLVPGLGDVVRTLLAEQYAPLLAGAAAAGPGRWGWLGADIDGFCAYAQSTVDDDLREAVEEHARELARQFGELAPGHQQELAFGNTLQMVTHWANLGKEDVAGFVGRLLYCMDTFP